MNVHGRLQGLVQGLVEELEVIEKEPETLAARAPRTKELTEIPKQLITLEREVFGLDRVQDAPQVEAIDEMRNRSAGDLEMHAGELAQ